MPGQCNDGKRRQHMDHHTKGKIIDAWGRKQLLLVVHERKKENEAVISKERDKEIFLY